MISVIIPTYNRIDLLKKCIGHLDASVQSLSPGLFEVIVTDDSDNAISKEYIEANYPQVKWVKGSGKGPAANRNDGANHASGEWLVFIDDDCIPDSNILKAYAEAINDNPGTLAFEGAIFPDSWDLLKKDMAECPVNTEGGCFWSANICIEKELFKNIGGFNEQFLIAAQEDQQLKIDIETGFSQKIVFVKEAKVVHPVRFTTLRKKVSNIPRTSKNFSLYAYKNRKILGYRSLFNFIKREIITHGRQSFFYLKHGMNKSFLVEVAWIFWGVPLNIINYTSLKKCDFSEGSFNNQ